MSPGGFLHSCLFFFFLFLQLNNIKWPVFEFADSFSCLIESDIEALNCNFQFSICFLLCSASLRWLFWILCHTMHRSPFPLAVFVSLISTNLVALHWCLHIWRKQSSFPVFINWLCQGKPSTSQPTRDAARASRQGPQVCLLPGPISRWVWSQHQGRSATGVWWPAIEICALVGECLHLVPLFLATLQLST